MRQQLKPRQRGGYAGGRRLRVIDFKDTRIQISVTGVHPEIYSLNVLYGNGSGFLIRPLHYTNLLGAGDFGQDEKKSRGHEKAEERGFDIDVFHSGTNVAQRPQQCTAEQDLPAGQ